MIEDGELSEEAIVEFNRCFRRTEYDVLQYKKYGPSNPYRVTDENEQFIPCKESSDGCCYMMTCNCHEDKPWYKGKCEICDKRINKKEAMRFPLWNGGFIGCYCKEHFKRESEDQMKMLCDIIEMISTVWKIEDDDEF